MNRSAWLVLVFSLILLSTFNSEAAIYYVAKDGDDSNPGTFALPWATIQHAADTLVAGDVVYVRAGTYNEMVIPMHSGASGAQITYAAFPGDTVTIDGQGISVPEYCGLFYLTGVDYIKVEGFRVIHSNQAGILADTCSYIVILRNYTYDTYSSGIGIWNVYNATVQANEVELACNDGGQESISIGNTQYFDVNDNLVHNGGPGTNGGEGICAKDGSAFGSVHHNVVHDMNRLGIYCDAWDKLTHDITFFANVSYANHGYGLAVACENGGTLQNIHIYDNVAYANYLDGFAFGGWGNPTTHTLQDIYLVNNTFYNNGTPSYWGGCISIENPEIQNIVVRNNACSQNAMYQIRKDVTITTGFTVDYNLIDGYRGYEDEIYGSNYVEGAAQFADAEGANFHLQANSPALDTGQSAEAPPNDFDGNPRPVGGGYDIGAFELQQTGSNFTVACSPTAFQVPQGSSYVTTCSVCSMGGFSSPVDMACAGVPAGMNCLFSPQSVTPPAGDCVTSNLEVTAADTVPPGQTTIQAVGIASALAHTYDFYPTVVASYLFYDDFEPDELWWDVVKGNWQETGGQMVGQAARKGLVHAAYLFPGCSNCTVESHFDTDGGEGNRVWVLGWYADRWNYVELMMKEETDRWILKQRINKAVVTKAKANRVIEPGVFYDAVISFDGSTFTVSIDGEPIITMPKYGGSAPYGSVGLQVKATTGRFEDVLVLP